MASSSMIKKLQIKPGMRVGILNAPPSYVDSLGSLPEGVELLDRLSGTFDLVHIFVKNKAELDREAPSAIAALKAGGILWISYPKRSSKVETDLTRDEGWRTVFDAGFEPVAQVAIDDVWAATRFKPREAGDPVEAQFAGPKAALRPIYDLLVDAAAALGEDVELAPRKTYVALVRRRQFGLIQASTRDRLDLGLKLPGIEPSGRLQAAGSFGSGQITHRVALSSTEDVDEAVLGWLREAYARVG